MSLKPLPRKFVLAVRQPNPMWILAGIDNVILGFGLISQNKNTEMFSFDIRDQYLDSIEDKFRELSKSIKSDTKRVILRFSREITIEQPRFIDIEGSAFPSLSVGAPFRQYFDGSFFEEKSNMGHASCACIDLEKKEITMQDPQGIPIKSEVISALKEPLKKTLKEFLLPV